MKGIVKLSEILLLITTIALMWMLHKQEQKKEKTISIYLPVDTMTVDATIYNAEVDQTDISPFITASGYVINDTNPGAERIVAVSQDFIKNKWLKYGDTILVTGVGNLSGKWIVRDCMNKRFTKTIDLLVNKGTKCWGTWKNI